MATRDNNDPNNPGGDWWSQQPPPPRISGPITDPHDPRLADPSYASDPDVLAFLNQRYAGGGTALAPPPTPVWDPQQQAWAAAPGGTENPTTGGVAPPGGSVITAPGAPIGVPTTGFGAPPTPYASDPTAPTYDPLPAYTPPTWTEGDYQNPTEADLFKSPGYQARMDAVLRSRNRSAAAQGTVLNGGTVAALGRDAQTFATNEYQNLRNNTFEAYKQRYAQFQDAAGMDLGARTLNANQNQNTFQNRLNTYTMGNTRTLSDYLTNYTGKRNSELDYWQRLQDLNQTGASLAGGSR